MSVSSVRQKLPRNLVGWVLAGVVVIVIVAAVWSNGTDLGQGEINRKAEAARKKSEAERFDVRVQDPKRRTQEALAEASKGGAAAQGPGAPASVPIDMAASQLELRRLEELKGHLDARPGAAAGTQQPGTGAPRQGRQGGSQQAQQPAGPDGGFVLFSAERNNQQGQGGQGPVVSVFKPDSGVGQGQAPAGGDEPRVAAAQRELDAARARAAAESPGAPEKTGGTSGERWLFDQQTAAPKELPANLVATRNRARHWLSAGTTIQAVLQSAVNTSLPGAVVARTTQPIYDSRYGQFLVLPAGSRLIGKYSSSVQDGQARVLMAFDRLVTPAGGEVSLGNMSASDALGRAGVEGELHSYFWQRMGISILLAAEGLAIERISPQQTTTGANGQSVTGRAGGAAAQIITNTANQELQRRFAVQPKITMDPGQLVNIVTTGSIEIPPLANAR